MINLAAGWGHKIDPYNSMLCNLYEVNCATLQYSCHWIISLWEFCFIFQFFQFYFLLPKMPTVRVSSIHKVNLSFSIHSSWSFVIRGYLHIFICLNSSCRFCSSHLEGNALDSVSARCISLQGLQKIVTWYLSIILINIPCNLWVALNRTSGVGYWRKQSPV